MLNKSPLDIMSEMSRLPSIRAERVVESYLGKWSALEGIVEDIDKSPSNANVIVVTLKTDELKIVSAYFLPNQKKYVEHLSPGETIRFVGRVDRIERHSLCYEDCFTL